MRPLRMVTATLGGQRFSHAWRRRSVKPWGQQVIIDERTSRFVGGIVARALQEYRSGGKAVGREITRKLLSDSSVGQAPFRVM